MSSNNIILKNCIVPQKRKCCGCGEIKFSYEFYKDKNRKGGFGYYCKKCCKTLNAKKYEKYSDKINKKSKEWKKNNADRVLETRKKYCEKYPEKIRENSRKWYENNRDKADKRNAEWRKNNPDKVRAWAKRWQQNNPEKVKERNKKYRINNSEKAKKDHKEWAKNNLKKLSEYKKLRYKESPEKTLMIIQKRDALKRGATAEKINPKLVYEEHNWICGICGKKINKNLKYPNIKRVSLDHIIPLSMGGNHVWENVQPAHLICNSLKGNRIKNLQLKLSMGKN